MRVRSIADGASVAMSWALYLWMEGSQNVTLVLGFHKRYDPSVSLDEQVELLSLIGDVALGDGEPQVHAHAVVGKRDGTAHGGHLLQARVRPTCEVVLTESPTHLRKEFDASAGIALIKLQLLPRTIVLDDRRLPVQARQRARRSGELERWRHCLVNCDSRVARQLVRGLSRRPRERRYTDARDPRGRRSNRPDCRERRADGEACKGLRDAHLFVVKVR